jgi:hypothetical protein
MDRCSIQLHLMQFAARGECRKEPGSRHPASDPLRVPDHLRNRLFGCKPCRFSRCVCRGHGRCCGSSRTQRQAVAQDIDHDHRKHEDHRHPHAPISMRMADKVMAGMMMIPRLGTLALYIMFFTAHSALKANSKLALLRTAKPVLILSNSKIVWGLFAKSETKLCRSCVSLRLAIRKRGRSGKGNSDIPDNTAPWLPR